MASPTATVLLVSSDADVADGVRTALGTAAALHVTDAASAVAEVEGRPFSVVFIDWDSPESNPGELCRVFGDRFGDIRSVALVSGGVPAAVAAMHAGADDVVQKPLDTEQLRYTLRTAFEAAERVLTEGLPSTAAAKGGLLGDSSLMKQVRELIARAAPGTATVLIRGETGTGKELVARAIHSQSPRRDRPFVKLHCAALPDTLLESELFGYEKGAFTGATARKPGRVEVAEGGTLFLDEIGDITPAMQVKLLRLVQDREYERLGSSETRRADVRIVAATHRDLETMVKQGEFRSDLFYRLNVVVVWTPPLRARRDDIEPLAVQFCRTFAEQNAKPRTRLGETGLRALRSQRWPGNVRQLQNLVERLVVIVDGDVIEEADVRRELSQQPLFSTQVTGAVLRTKGAAETLATEAGSSPNVAPLSEEVRAAEKRALERALRHTKGNRTLAARLLGISRATLYAKLEEYGIE
jgi:two-component system response regulator AtoC